MGVQVTLKDIQSGFLTASAFNSNNTAIESAFDKTLDRTSNTNNQMQVDLDMGTNKIFNLKDAVSGQEAINYSQLQRILAAGTGGYITVSKETTHTATAGQTLVSFSDITYKPGTNNLSVYVNGVRQTVGDDYLETSSSSITFISALQAGDLVNAYTNDATTSIVSDAQNVSYTSNSVTQSVKSFLDSIGPLRSDLSSSNVSKGAALVVGVGRVVNSISDLKTLPKTGSNRAFVAGYYTPGDGGGGQFYYDSTDITSSDNGGSVIVAADNGRWKLIHNGTIDIRQFGAKGDGVTDDTIAIQSAWNSFLSTFFPDTGNPYKITGNLSFQRGTTITGAGKHVEIKGYGSGTAMLSASDSSNLIQNLTIKDITFTADSTSTYAWVLAITNPEASTMINVLVNNNYISASGAVNMEKSSVSGSITSWIMKIAQCMFYTASGKPLQENITDSVFTDVYCTGGSGSIAAGGNNEWQGCMFDNCQIGLTVSPNYEVSPPGAIVSFIGCKVQSASNIGLFFNGGTGSRTAMGINAIGCNFSNSTAVNGDIQIQNAEHINLIGNYHQNNSNGPNLKITGVNAADYITVVGCDMPNGMQGMLHENSNIEASNGVGIVKPQKISNVGSGAASVTFTKPPGYRHVIAGTGGVPSSLTINLNFTPVDGQTVELLYSTGSPGTAVSLTVSPTTGTVFGIPSNMPANSELKLVYNSTDGYWIAA